MLQQVSSSHSSSECEWITNFAFVKEIWNDENSNNNNHGERMCNAIVLSTTKTTRETSLLYEIVKKSHLNDCINISFIPLDENIKNQLVAISSVKITAIDYNYESDEVLIHFIMPTVNSFIPNNNYIDTRVRVSINYGQPSLFNSLQCNIPSSVRFNFKNTIPSTRIPITNISMTIEMRSFVSYHLIFKFSMEKPITHLTDQHIHLCWYEECMVLTRKPIHFKKHEDERAFTYTFTVVCPYEEGTYEVLMSCESTGEDVGLGVIKKTNVDTISFQTFDNRSEHRVDLYRDSQKLIDDIQDSIYYDGSIIDETYHDSTTTTIEKEENSQDEPPSIKSNRIPLVDEKMVENGIRTLLHKMTAGSLDVNKELLHYLIDNSVPQKHLDAFFNPGKRHARHDKVPYLNVKVVIYDEAAIPSQENQNIPPKLKVALFFAKFVISFDENSHLITIEDQERKENFLYQAFYDCNIKTVRKSDEIDQFLLNLAKFNCQWNCTQFYDEKHNNSGHYVIAALKHLGIWNPSQLWAQFTTNVCEGNPLEKHVTLYPDFFHMDSKNNIPTALNGSKAVKCPRLIRSLLDYIESQTDAPFQYSFKGYSTTNPKLERDMARQELELFCELLRTCGESYLKNMEDGVRVQRLLKKIMQTNYGQSLTSETWQHLKPVSEKHNQTFHKQMYNFPNFLNLIKPTPESEQLEKIVKQIYDENNQPQEDMNHHIE